MIAGRADEAATVPERLETPGEIRQRTERREIQCLLQDPTIGAVLELDQVGEDDGPCPRIDVSILPATGERLHQQTGGRVRVLGCLDHSEPAQRESLIARVVDLGREGEGLGEAMGRRPAITGRERAVGYDIRLPRSPRAQPALPAPTP